MYFYLTSAVICLLIPISSANSQETPESNQAESVATIDDFAWIAGHWQGEAMGGTFEETWNPPLGGTMIGMFKLVKDGEVQFLELVTISEHAGKFSMRVKHFDSDFVGWEAKDKFVEFPFLNASDTELVFDGLKMASEGTNRLRTTVRVKQGEEVSELTFNASRVVRDAR